MIEVHGIAFEADGGEPYLIEWLEYVLKACWIHTI